MTKTASQLYEAANRAAADAIRFRRCPNGGRMASMRSQDATTLRAMARSAAQASA